MAKDMYNGNLEDSIFLMSDSFRAGVKAAYNTTNLNSTTNSRSCLKRNNGKNPLGLSLQNHSPRKLFLTDESPKIAYANMDINQEKLDVGLKTLDEREVNPLTDI